MNENVIKSICSSTSLDELAIREVLSLLSEGSTIPFIARYRKERTGGLDENQIRSIECIYKYSLSLLTRKEDVIRLIDEKGLLTEEIKNSVLACNALVDVEDIYRPFKEKRKTKATEAIAKGLEGLAKKIMSFPVNGSVQELCKDYDMDSKEAIEGASYIISEWISDNAFYRKLVRNFYFNTGKIVSVKKKNSVDEKMLYDMYYDFSENVKYIKHYRLLAINRGEKEKILTVNIVVDEYKLFILLRDKIIKNSNSFVNDIVEASIKDSLKRLIVPSIIREIRSDVTILSEDKAIDTFSNNLEHLLMTRPIKGRTVIGFDPAFRTGCKLAVLDQFGNVLEIGVIYPHPPVNKRQEAFDIFKGLINKYNVELIAIGNGTASRESEAFVAEAIKNTNAKYLIVSEAGASVYSASKEAQREFPTYHVEQRSAVSIGRRVQDPLSELVKIDPKSIGVGEYQHDVDSKKLNSSLEFTVLKIVNEVGVCVNTASEEILKYVSGLNKTSINAIIKSKEKSMFKNREQIRKLKGISAKTYEQCIGFLRINDGDNIMDKTGIHPESYNETKKILDYLNLDINDINKEEFKEKLKNVNIKELLLHEDIDKFTLEDIIKELLNPGLDPREKMDAPILKSDILTIDDLNVGDKLEGTVRNVASFGAFIDIGLHDDGLLHISKMSKSFVSDPKTIVSVGDIVECYVDKIDKVKGKISLSLLEV
ncbi:MAG: Tex family protein [Bacilli bacterium]